MRILGSDREEVALLVLALLPWQQEVELPESCAKSPKEETQRETSMETEGEDCSVSQHLGSNQRVGPTEGDQPKPDRETSSEAFRHEATSPSHAAGGAWLSQVEALGGEIILPEDRAAIKAMALGKTPDTDGLPVELSATSVEDLATKLVDVYNTAKDISMLPPSIHEALVVP
ncbi:hypothetical protein NDU88_003731 [Pleurodeles waltl]|uniref:Uncharacterized protein n=1 Tax=Pleurodeles waltl TaxID=8319 RepID=A0AAV7TQJ5_PLEWA|nr:hypothetical protein NDU88_003731 [Pleurodeles waltl]